MPRFFASNRKRTCYFLLGNGHETRWICPMLITQSPCFRLLGCSGVWFFLTGGGHAQLTGGAATVSAGVSIGQVRIGETLDDVHRALGTPKLSDAAMGGKLLFSHQTRIRGQSRISRASQKKIERLSQWDFRPGLARAVNSVQHSHKLNRLA